ncbi:MAG: methionyl-tRNA formyltransferase [Candidimonas sp.]|nr:MAG: methionyl-tRNA formyltransferase [Candidimonas sp.]TAM25254.1 MAG: methionyl-tRNA formyltransferase [Candidimonas sp.]TAM76757.1 MAG: methionyl-tRNA formyltransferase [Candidimonas sp.]
MRIAFAGTPQFARLALEAILDAGHEVGLVLTQPDRPSGRGLKLMPSAVKQAAMVAGIPVLQARSLRLDGKYPDEAQAARHALSMLVPEAIVVAAYGLILPQWVLSLPRFGCLNIHASLLPRWRGAAPIQRAIEAGDAQTGITIMQMDAGLDTGDMLRSQSLEIGPAQNAAQLHDELAMLGAGLIVQVLDEIAGKGLTATPQPAEGASYAAKLDKSEAALDFLQSADLLERRIRAFNPVPGASLRLPGLNDPVKAWSAKVLNRPAQKAPGELESVGPDGLDVATADGVLRLLELQKAGGKRQPVAAFVQGWQIPA